MILTLLLLAHLHIIIKSACLPKPCYKDYSTLSYEQYQTTVLSATGHTSLMQHWYFQIPYYTWKSLFTISEFSLFGYVLFLLEKFVCGLFYRDLYIGQETEK